MNPFSRQAVLPVDLVGPVSVVVSAEQVGAARLELELSGDVGVGMSVGA